MCVPWPFARTQGTSVMAQGMATVGKQGSGNPSGIPCMSLSGSFGAMQEVGEVGDSLQEGECHLLAPVIITWLLSSSQSAQGLLPWVLHSDRNFAFHPSFFFWQSNHFPTEVYSFKMIGKRTDSLTNVFSSAWVMKRHVLMETSLCELGGKDDLPLPHIPFNHRARTCNSCSVPRERTATPSSVLYVAARTSWHSTQSRWHSWFSECMETAGLIFFFFLWHRTMMLLQRVLIPPRHWGYFHRTPDSQMFTQCLHFLSSACWSLSPKMTGTSFSYLFTSLTTGTHFPELRRNVSFVILLLGPDFPFGAL